MNRLQSELHRLYLLPSPDPGKVRAMVLELTGPADWYELSKVWRGVQADLGLPAPAIAVSGGDGMQLWFSLQVAVSAQCAETFLTQLCAQYLPGIARGRTRLWPTAAEGSSLVPVIPKQSASTGNWSAFVAPDLAAIFGDDPSLDIEPGVEGQTDLLARLESIGPADLDAAMLKFAPAASAHESATPALPAAAPRRSSEPPADRAPDLDPRQFLQQVLNDETVELALRIEAAKALLRSP